MRIRAILLISFLLVLCGCSTKTVQVTTVRLYDSKPYPEKIPALIEGIWGVFGKGVATAICGVDGRTFDPCVIAVELLPGNHTIDVRLILASATIHRTYVMNLGEASMYVVVPARKMDGFEEPVIEFKRFRVKDRNYF